MVGLLEAGEGERARDELAGFGDGGGRGLMRVERAAVVFWRSEFVPRRCERKSLLCFKENDAVGGRKEYWCRWMCRRWRLTG